MRVEQTVRIPGGGYSLAATIHVPEQSEAAGHFSRITVLICHGFVGSRIGVDRLFVKAARNMAAHGFNVVRFDYAGCGESEGEYGAGGMDALLRQTRDVLEHVRNMESGAPGKLILLGHSLGGAVSLLTAARDSRVDGLVLWAPVLRPFEDIVRIVGEESYREALQYGQTDHRGYVLRDTFFQSLRGYEPLREAKRFTGDVLLLHGNRDEVIPVDSVFHYERELRLRQTGRCETEVIVRGDHTFSAHDAYQRLISRTTAWLAQQAGNETVAV
ncbi:lysophospholipase [Brevibacillus sp. WF146]|nr:alpha/beta fold hydrolase [Brevibacillus sp. WF146]UYZ13059.1 lysophospholipase [Brevibacillus sp. WF146]